MLITNLLIHEWKKSFRARSFYKNLAVNLILLFFGLYMSAVMLFLGFSLNDILAKLNSSLNPVELVNGATLYVLLGGLIVRFAMQQLNTFNLPLYQTLPVKRSLLVNFLLLRPLTNPVNYFQLLIIIPFAIRSVTSYYSVPVCFRFIFSFILLSWFNSLLVAYLKRRYGSGMLPFFLLIALTVGIAALEYFRVFSLFNISKALYGFVIFQPYGLVLSLIGVAGVFLLNKCFFHQYYYSEGFNRKVKTDKTINADLSFLNRFGIIGDLIGVELKLILRHKRTKHILYMSAFFLFYGLIFYPQKAYGNSNGMLFFVATFITGLLMLMYGQWSISWDSRHFDSLMTRNISIKTYIYSNYYLMMTLTLVCFVLSSPYFLFGQKIVFMHLAAFLYNAGVNIYLLLFLSTYNTKRVDLSRTSAMNYQGTTYKSFLIVMPVSLIPMLLVFILSAWFSLNVALFTISIIGLTGILLHKPILAICVNQFNHRKYKLAEGFRESE